MPTWGSGAENASPVNARKCRDTRAPLGTFLPPGERFERVHLDIVGPLPPSEGNRYILTCIDRFTRWSEAIPLPVATAESIAKAFLAHWISRFGIPTSVTTNQGRQFESFLWRDFMRLLGIERIRSTCFHPISNGLVERLHRQLKASLACQPQPERWTEALPLVMLGIRSAVKKDLQCTTAELVYGSPLRLPGQFFSTSSSTLADPSSYLARLRSCATSWRPATSRPVQVHSFIPKDLSSCTHVFVRHDAHRSSLQPKYDGPFPVLLRKEKFFTIQRPSRKEVVSIDRLKPAYVEADPIDTPIEELEPLPPSLIAIHHPLPSPSVSNTPVVPPTPPPSIPTLSPLPPPPPHSPQPSAQSNIPHSPPSSTFILPTTTPSTPAGASSDTPVSKLPPPAVTTTPTSASLTAQQQQPPSVSLRSILSTDRVSRSGRRLRWPARYCD